MGPNSKGLSKSYILQAVEDSLLRLQTDFIDLYQSHADDPDTPLEETLEAYDLLIRQGKVRAIGASNYSARRLAQAATSACSLYSISMIVSTTKRNLNRFAATMDWR